MKKKLLQNLSRKLANSSFKEGKMVPEKMTRSVKVLKSLPNYQALYALSEYLAEVKAIEKKHTMYVETVVSLPPRLLRRAKKAFRTKIKITKVLASINPNLLGGVKIKAGDEIWDGSILGKIDQLKEAIVNG